MNTFSFSTSLPPSSNMMFINVPRGQKGLGRFPSPAYKAWRAKEAKAVADQWRRAGSPTFEPHLSLTVHVGVNYQSDVSNRLKAIEDLLPHAIPGFPDDRWIDRIAIERVPGLDGARVLIMQGCAPVAEAA